MSSIWCKCGHNMDDHMSLSKPGLDPLDDPNAEWYCIGIDGKHSNQVRGIPDTKVMELVITCPCTRFVHA